MRVTTVSAVADRGRSNEDFVGSVPNAVVVVDGAFIPGAERACRHGVAWYAHRLGGCLLDLAGGAAPLVVTDAREVEVSRPYVPALEAARDDAERDRVLSGQRSRRNHAGGFWVAKDDPRAADEALTGQVPVQEVRAVAVLSNGASRVVDTFGLTDWAGLMADLASTGPDVVVARVRAAEQRHGVAQDDATIAYSTDLADP